MLIDKDKIVAAANWAYAKHRGDSIPNCFAATLRAAVEAMVDEVNSQLGDVAEIKRKADNAASDAYARSLSSGGGR